VTATGIKEKIVAQRIAWIEGMVRGVAGLPLDSLEHFMADARNVAAADSYVRRALEALLDLGRHILARGFGRAVSEYREVARQLLAAGVLTADDARVMGEMAGYRNRLVHFYDEVTPPELYRICTERLPDVTTIVNGLRIWIQQHPERVDRAL
jgi:uncharacterized protein YutE (UPF0331/DUF86 family)